MVVKKQSGLDKRNSVRKGIDPNKRDISCRRSCPVLVMLILVAVAGILILASILKDDSKDLLGLPVENVREPYVADQFYPGDSKILGQIVGFYLDNSLPAGIGDVHALILPHAGYVYSGQVAAEGIKQLETEKGKIRKVFIIGNNHVNGAWFDGISIPNYTHYETPLGKIKVAAIAAEMRDEYPFTFNEQAHTSHIIEVQLPFLQKEIGDDFEIIPMVVGGIDEGMIEKAAEVIGRYLDDSSILIVSSDLSHYYPYDDAVALDRPCIDKIEAQDYAGAASCEACGRDAILILLRISAMHGWQSKVIDYRNSGDVTGDKSSVVGYSAIAFYTEGEVQAVLEKQEKSDVEVVDEAEQEFLLELARNTVENYVKYQKTPDEDSLELTPALKEVMGCFVTLNEDGQLRGCIGHILPQEPLYRCVIDNAVNAAVNDERFHPVTADELDDLHIDVSVLTVPVPLDYSSPEDLLSQLRPDIDGVVLRYGFRSSTFLPQVWEQIPDKNMFLESLCKKQGSQTDCWKDAKVDVYQAQVFKEHE
ncbi:MAG: AmmeMemoRadiSam system protein B [Candidatus Woesearchaeota archaeon]